MWSKTGILCIFGSTYKNNEILLLGLLQLNYPKISYLYMKMDKIIV